MALSEKHRSELFTYFEPRLGVETTEAFIRNLPRVAEDELVTRDYLDLRLDALAADFRAELGDFRSGIVGRLTALLLSATTVLLAALAIATTVIVATVG